MSKTILDVLAKPHRMYYIFANSEVRESLLSLGWHMKGAYAEKDIDGQCYMIRTIKEGSDHSLYRILLKSVFWDEMQKKNHSDL